MTAHVARLATPVTERDHIRGSVTAPVTLLEYGDFECPYCGAAYPIVEEVRRLAGDQLRFVYRHFPLSNIHTHAERAAEAAEAAGAQGQFWEMHDMLFEHQDTLDDESLLAYADLLNLDLRRFAGDLATSKHAPRVQEDFMSGVRSGVNGTPTFFINDIRYDGPRDVVTLTRVIAEAARQTAAASRPRTR